MLPIRQFRWQCSFSFQFGGLFRVLSILLMVFLEGEGEYGVDGASETRVVFPCVFVVGVVARFVYINMNFWLEIPICSSGLYTPSLSIFTCNQYNPVCVKQSKKTILREIKLKSSRQSPSDLLNQFFKHHRTNPTIKRRSHTSNSSVAYP